MTPPREPSPAGKQRPGTYEPCIPARERMLRNLRAYLSRERMPRLILFVIVAFTATAGFWCSRLFLHLGFDSMGWRYVCSTLAAWGILIVLVRLWVQYECSSFRSPDDFTNLPIGHEPDSESEVSLESVGRIVEHGVDAVDAEEGCFVGVVVAIAVVLLFGVLIGVFTLVAGAPALLAEALLDVAVAGFLGGRLRAHDAQWWAAGVFRRTWKIALPLAVALGIIGGVLQHNHPGARNLGDVLR